MRLTGRRWYEFLEEEDLIDIGKDPARFPIAVRERYLEMVREEGTEAVSEEAAVQQMTRYHHLTLLRPSPDRYRYRRMEQMTTYHHFTLLTLLTSLTLLTLLTGRACVSGD